MRVNMEWTDADDEEFADALAECAALDELLHALADCEVE